MAANLWAEDFGHQQAAAIDDQMLVGKCRGGVDEPHEFHNAFDPSEVTAGRDLKRSHEINGDCARSRLAIFQGEACPELAHPRLAVLLGYVPREKHE
jgi:hypothetical protein